MGSDGTQRIGRHPSARATARKGLIPPAKARRKRGHKANGIEQMRPMQRKSGWHAQDTAIERQQGSPQKRTRIPPRRSEEWNGQATPTGPQTEQQREIGDGPLKGKNQGERLEHSQACGCSEGHSKRASRPRAQRETADRGRCPTRRRYFQAQNTTCVQEEVQFRWPWK